MRWCPFSRIPLWVSGRGSAGTLTANRLRRTYGEAECRSTVVDQSDDRVYQPGLLFVPPPGRLNRVGRIIHT